MTGRWHRDTWAEAVWASELKPLQRLVAFAYADHAGDGQTAWVSYDRLRRRTGMSRDAVARALRAVVDAGWLVEVEAARQHRSTRYRLALQQSASRTADDVDPGQQSASRTAQQSASRTADPSSSPSDDTSSPSDDTSSPSGVPDLTTYLTTYPTAREESAVHVQSSDRPQDGGGDSERLHGAAVAAAVAAGKSAAAWSGDALEAVARRLVAAHDVDQRDVPAVLLAGARHDVITTPGGIAAPGFLAVLQQQTVPERRSADLRDQAALSVYRCDHDHPNGLKRAADGTSLCSPCCEAGAVPA